VREVLRLTHAPAPLVGALGVAAGAAIALGSLALPPLAAWAALASLAFSAVGLVLARRREGPAPQGTADFLVFAGTLLGLTCAGLVNGSQVLAALAALAVMLTYSPLLKPYPVVGNVAVAVVAGSPPFYGALAVGLPAAGVVPWLLAAWLHVVREIVKDVEDEAGDRTIGRRTLPIVVGRRPALLVAAAAGLFFVPASLVLPRSAGYGGAYFLIALLAQMAVLVVATWMLLGRVDRVSALLKIAMVVGLIALVAGKVA